MKKLLVVLSIALMSVTLFARPDVLPAHSVRGTNNTAYASYSYGCAGAYKNDITLSVSLDNPSRGTTVVVVQVTTNSSCYTKRVEIANGSSYTIVSFNIGSGNCGTIEILDAYVK